MFLPRTVDRYLSLASHYLPRRTQDPAAVSPRLPTASLDAPRIMQSSLPFSSPTAVGDTTDSRNK
jgi:hypothetical protein